MPEYFPMPSAGTPSLKNPAIQLFGNRLFSDQTASELLVELLLVVSSPKRFGDWEPFLTPLPPDDWYGNAVDEQLSYAPKARLNLKLFSFLGASRLDSRHRTHHEHHAHLLKELKNSIDPAGNGDKEGVIRTIENLFLGFQGAGSNRTWCAQCFLPVSPVFITCEAIWKDSQARRVQPEDWNTLFPRNHPSLFDMTQHVFFARGGELLYLQLCNSLRQPRTTIAEWLKQEQINLTQDEQDPEWLRSQLALDFEALFAACPTTLTKLAEFIDTGVEQETAAATDTDNRDNDERRWVSSGWCKTESWREGYLLAIELHRLLNTHMDLVDQISLLELACAMQALRTLARQSERSAGDRVPGDIPEYRFAVSAPDEKRPAIRRLSQGSLKRTEKSIFQALRGDSVELTDDEESRNRILKQADKAYGGKLFVGLSKRIGLVVPKRGAGARFVITEQLLRLFVMTIIPPGSRITFDTFKQQLESRQQLVFDAEGMARASRWLDGQGMYLPADTDRWLTEMLEAAGFLIHLSDSCALVQNPADSRKDSK
jgi:hypothetical protein